MVQRHVSQYVGWGLHDDVPPIPENVYKTCLVKILLPLIEETVILTGHEFIGDDRKNVDGQAVS